MSTKHIEREHPRWWRRRVHVEDLGPRRTHPTVHRIEQHSGTDGDALRVLTLNTAHGRARGLHQTLQRRHRIYDNLEQIGDVIAREAPDIVALQETDAPSFWSGQIDHADLIADRAGLGWYLRGAHVRGPRLAYGTALLANRAIDDGLSVRFRRSPPTPTKGFVVGAVRFDGRSVDVVSLHLDFSRAAVRRRQLVDLVRTVHERGRPVVVMGDFNCRWSGREQTLQALVDALDLIAWRPGDDGHGTFHRTDSRLDWVLTSRSIAFERHRTLTDPLSDHRAVTAVLRWT